MNAAAISREREIGAPVDLLVCAVDRDTAGHLAVALHRHVDALEKSCLVVPPAIAQFAEMALQIVNRPQEASTSIGRLDSVEDDLREREFLSRTDIKRLTGSSLATIDRWVGSGQLPSSKRGRTRRIARRDLDRFLAV